MVEKAYGLFLMEKAKASEHGALMLSKNEIFYEDYYECKFIYNTDEEQMKHKEIMESSGHRCYQCGTASLYKDNDKEFDRNKGFFQNNVRVPTSIFGINKDGLLHEARLIHGYYKD